MCQHRCLQWKRGCVYDRQLQKRCCNTFTDAFPVAGAAAGAGCSAHTCLQQLASCIARMLLDTCRPELLAAVLFEFQLVTRQCITLCAAADGTALQAPSILTQRMVWHGSRALQSQ